MALSACGGGTDDPETSADGTRHLEIASATSSLSAGPMLAAISLDTFAGNDLDITYTDFAGSSPNTIAALSSGDADIALVGAATGWDAIQEGAPLTIVAAITGNTSELGMRTDVAERLGVTEDDPIEDRVAALKGLTIATAQTGSANYQMIRSLVTLYGLDPDTDVTIVPSEPTAIVAGLQNKAIDAAFYGTGVVEQNYADGSAVPMINLPRGDVPELNDIVFAFAMARDETVKDEPELLESFVQSLRDAGTQIEQKDDEVREAVKKDYFPDLPEDVFKLSWEQVSPAWLLDCTMTEGQLEASLEFQSETTGKSYDNVSFDNVAEIAQA
jgi:NitT/TauT family transport system substrate-binding protein